MKEFDIQYKDIILKVICDEYIRNLIYTHFFNHVNFLPSTKNSTYTLIISDKIPQLKGIGYKMIDKWFDNATLDCYIDNENRICYATNFLASTIEYRNLLIQYFVANLFNRFLEIKGYIGVHSSCVEQNQKGVLFVAGRNSGKTVSMLNLLNDGFNIVTNDKIALKDYENHDIIGYGIAQSISIRLSPKFCEQIENKKYVDLALQRGIEIKKANMLEGNNIILSEAELTALNNVRQVFDSKINCIIKPLYDHEVKEPIFELMSKEETRNLIISQYMTLVHDTTSFLENIHLNGEKGIDRNKILNEIERIQCYSCRQNENTTEQFVQKVKKLIL